MTEKDLKAKFCTAVRASMPGVVLFRHEDKMTSAIPDISATWHQHTTWIECKHFTGRDTFRDLQTLRLRELKREGHCAFYLVWETPKRGGEPRTWIVDPDHVPTAGDAKGWSNWRLTSASQLGYDHLFVIKHLWRVHA